MPALDRLDVTALRAVVVAFRDVVRDHAEVLNRLNVYPVPDGDTGTNMARTLEAVVAEMENSDDGLDATCDAISHGSLMGARGNSGVILSQILRGVATTLKSALADTDRSEDGAGVGAGADDGGGSTGRGVAAALSAAAAGAYQAVLKPVEGTILTVARESAAAADAAAAAGAALVDVLDAASQAGRDALARTPELLPALRDAGVVDAGGAGYLLFLDAALHVVAGRPLPVADVDSVPDAVGAATGPHPGSGTSRVVSGVGGDLDVSEQRYEVMYLCEVADTAIGELKEGWGRIGDSIVVVGGDGLWNCHVHTNDIGRAIEAALDLGGRPRDIRVTDLFEEVAEEHAHREAAMRDGHVAPLRDVVECGVVAVSSGDGLSELFRGLGVREIVTGGQTANPSTAELLDAVERADARSVVILPNNKNIIPVAQQVVGLASRPVQVVPSVSMPEGLAALVVHDPDGDAQGNASEMSDAINLIVTGEVTCAIRSSTSAAGPVSEGDFIGLVRGDGIVAVAADLEGAAVQLLDRIVGDDREIVTVIAGADAVPAVTASIERWLDDHRPAVEVEIHHGGQPLYPYLFGVE